MLQNNFRSPKAEMEMFNCFLQVMYDKYTNSSRRFGFVTMSTAEEANAAVEALNGTVSIQCCNSAPGHICEL